MIRDRDADSFLIEMTQVGLQFQIFSKVNHQQQARSLRTSSFRLHICVYQVNLLWLSWQNFERNYKRYLRESAAKRTRITQRIFSTKKSLTQPASKLVL